MTFLFVPYAQCCRSSHSLLTKDVPRLNRGSWQQGLRWFHRSSLWMEEGDEESAAAEAAAQAAAAQAAAEAKKAEKLRNKKIVSELHAKRVEYRKQVSRLRKEYASEVALQRASDEAERATKLRQETRRKLERQHLKNIRSAQSALRKKYQREERHKEFEEELRIAQINREARKARFAKARQLLIDELEEEAPLWLTTYDEVERAFTPEAEQMLWAYPNSVFGAPVPTDDAMFWRYESHTWSVRKSYRTRGEMLLEQLEELAYDESNIDTSIWNQERTSEREGLEEKATLRAMVRDAGRRSLLLKQREMLHDRVSKSGNADPAIPKSMPVPSTTFLANTKAQEKEGARLILQDPTKFFEFEQRADDDQVGDDDDNNNNNNSESYSGPSLGAPIGLRDPSQNKTFPIIMGALPKPDARTEREKKRDAKEERMRAAAAEAEATSKGGDAADDVDFDFNNWDSLGPDRVTAPDEDEFEDGLDPDRYTNEEVEWVGQKLDKQIASLEQQLNFDIDLAKQDIQARRDSVAEQEAAVSQVPKEEDGDSSSHPNYTITAGEGTYKLDDIGVDVDQVDSIFSSLTEEQLIALHEIDAASRTSPFSPDSADVASTATPDGLREKLSTVPGLSEELIEKIVALEQELGRNKNLLAEREMLVETNETVHGNDAQ